MSSWHRKHRDRPASIQFMYNNMSGERAVCDRWITKKTIMGTASILRNSLTFTSDSTASHDACSVWTTELSYVFSVHVSGQHSLEAAVMERLKFPEKWAQIMSFHSFKRGGYVLDLIWSIKMHRCSFPQLFHPYRTVWMLSSVSLDTSNRNTFSINVQ